MPHQMRPTKGSVKVAISVLNWSNILWYFKTIKSNMPFFTLPASFLSHELSNFDLVTPTKVTSDGTFLSHDLKHFSAHPARSRTRRSTRTDDARVHYMVHIGGTQTILNLRPNHALLGPAMVVERRGKTMRVGPSVHNREHCFFHGYSVNNGTFSFAALSTCDGLVSAII